MISCEACRPGPVLDCVLADPMIRLVMESDGVTELDLRETLEAARDRLREGIAEAN